MKLNLSTIKLREEVAKVSSTKLSFTGDLSQQPETLNARNCNKLRRSNADKAKIHAPTAP